MTESIDYMKSKKYLYAIAFFIIIVFGYYNSASLEKALITNIVFLENFYGERPVLFIVLYFVSYVLLTTLSLPVALFLGLLSGFILELHVAVLLISFASSIGATLAMLIARYLIRDYIDNKFNRQVKIINSELNKNGLYYLFALRMSPLFPFFIINLAFGLTKIKALLFYIISQVGMLPGTIIIILVGSELDDFLIEGNAIGLELVIYLSLMGLLPLIFKKLAKSETEKA